MSNKNGSKWIEPDMRLACYLRDSFTCAWCARDMTQAQRWEITLDHIVSRAYWREMARDGNVHATSNLTTACVRCNSQRAERTIEEYAPVAAAAHGTTKARIINRIERLSRVTPDVEFARTIIRGTPHSVEDGTPRDTAHKAIAQHAASKRRTARARKAS